MFWKVFRWVGVSLGPTKGLEELKIEYDITYGNLLPKLPNTGNLGTKLVLCHNSPLKLIVNDENQQKAGKCVELLWYGGAKRWGWAIFRGKVANFSLGRMMSSVMSHPIFSHFERFVGANTH